MDITPAGVPEPAGPEVLSMEGINALERKLMENKQAQLRGDPLPHEITPEQLRAAIAGIRRCRGTMDLYKPTGEGGKKAAGGGTKGASKIELLDLDGL